MNKALIRVGDLPTFTAAPEVVVERDTNLELLKAILFIEDQFSADCAGQTLTDATTLSRRIEAGRVEVKAPVLELGRTIDTVAKSLTAPLDAEISRVQRLVGGYLSEQRRKQAEAEAEIRRQEAARIAEAQQAESPTAAVEQIREAVQATNTAVAALAPPKLAGVGLRQRVEIEVFNPAALYAVRPDLVELKPRLALIKESLVTTKELPGVRVTTEAVATVRTSHAAS